MRKTAWDRQIRPAIAWGAFIIFLFLIIGRDTQGSRAAKRYEAQLHANLREKLVHIEVRKGGRGQDYSGSGRGAGRHLLGAGDEVPTGKGTDDLHPTTQESISEVEQGQPLDVSPLNGSRSIPSVSVDESAACANAAQHVGYRDSCSFVKAIPQCSSGTLIEYTQVFYCFFAGTPVLAYTALTFWLVALFYMLGNTAADFFCCAIEKLSKLLHLPPTVAGVTLLPFGNGAPDVFASIAAFVGASGQGQVGLNSVLGGATFVSSVVAGSVSLVIAAANVPVHLDRRCFLRDVGFFLFSLAALTTILFLGKIGFWGSVAYVSIYALYAFTVAAVEFLRSHRHKFTQWHALQPLLSGIPPHDRGLPASLSDDESGGSYMEIVDQIGVSSAVETSLPQWMWAPHVAIYSHNLDRQESVANRQLWGWSEEQAVEPVKWYSLRGLCSYFVEWPLTIARRLTIPLVEDASWSKPYTVCSATFAPTLLAMVWDGKDSGPFGSAWKEYIVAWCIGICLGGLSLATLKKERPPRRYLFPWAAGGFIMSIVWFYIIANELVAALVALGVVLEIDPAILGLTVLAWGNSIGDLMSNLALVYHGGDGVQIAFSGCYAGPMFNTLMGVGLSFVLASWKTYPAAFDIPQDDTIFITLAFLVAGLIWALCMLPSRSMQPTKTLGVGLLVLYASFLSLRLVHALGLNPWLAAHDNHVG